MKILIGIILLLAVLPAVNAVEGCRQLPYWDIDGATEDLLLTDNDLIPFGYDCIEFSGDPNDGGRAFFDDTVILSGWSTLEFRCVDGAYITQASGSTKPAFSIGGGWKVVDCVVKNREIGYELRDNGKTYNSNASNADIGALAYDNAEVLGGIFTQNNIGVFLTGNAAAYNVRSEYNNLGFKLEGNSRSSGSRAGYNELSFGKIPGDPIMKVPGDPIITGTGFYLQDNAVVTSAWTNANEGSGYYITGAARVSTSVAEGDMGGFTIKETGSCVDCSSKYNQGSGFDLTDQSSVSRSNSYKDCQGSTFCYGFKLRGGSTGSALSSKYNPKGIYLDSGASLFGALACENNVLDLSYFGTLHNTVKADTYEGDGYIVDGKLVSCSWTGDRRGTNKFNFAVDMEEDEQ